MLQVEKPMSPWIKYMYMKRKKERKKGRKEGKGRRQNNDICLKAQA